MFQALVRWRDSFMNRRVIMLFAFNLQHVFYFTRYFSQFCRTCCFSQKFASLVQTVFSRDKFGGEWTNIYFDPKLLGHISQTSFTWFICVWVHWTWQNNCVSQRKKYVEKLLVEDSLFLCYMLFINLNLSFFFFHFLVHKFIYICVRARQWLQSKT